MEKFYKDLSLEFKDSTFDFKDVKYMGNGGSYMIVSTYYIYVPYKNYMIETISELGNSNMGKISVCVNHNVIPNFKIDTIDHFTNLFLRRKNLLKVKCTTDSFKKILLEAAEFSNLNDVIRKNSLEPKIYNERNENLHYIKTDYSLQFEDKIGGLRALINFYKRIIDHL